MKKFLEEFKAFALKGNVMDLAVGVIIGGAFSNIVTALTNDFITPLIAALTHSTDAEGNIQIGGKFTIGRELGKQISRGILGGIKNMF